MTTQSLSPAQEKLRNIVTKDPVEDILSAINEGSGKLRSDRLHIPQTFVLGECGPVILLEDRDKHAETCKSRRFDVGDLGLVLNQAQSVSIVLYGPRKHAPRLGVNQKADSHARILSTRLQAGGAVIIRTTSDRLRIWLERARRSCKRGVPIEYFDASGVSRVVEGGL